MFRKLFCCISFIFLPAAVSFSQSPQSTQTVKQKVAVVVPSKTIGPKTGLVEGRVIYVYDGDTVTIQAKDRSMYSIRLQGIDAPEAKQADHKDSRKNLVKLVLNEDVKVVVHKKDLHDRYIGSIYLDGRDIGLAQIETGMAWHYKQYDYEQTAEDRKKYAEGETKSKTDRIGLWKEPNPTPPWIFRGETIPANVTKAVKSGIAAETVAPADAKYILGPRGGCYYVSESGRKVYVKDKTLCTVSGTGPKQ